MEVSGQLHARAALPPGKKLLIPIVRRQDGPQSRSGRGGEEKNSQTLPRLDPSIIQPIDQCCTIELSWLILLKKDMNFYTCGRTGSGLQM
jgi:hypothetical protein